MTTDTFAVLIELMEHIAEQDRKRARALTRELLAQDRGDADPRDDAVETYRRLEIARGAHVRMRALLALARDLQNSGGSGKQHFGPWIPGFHQPTQRH